jgi:4-hydroxy-tetrahydrodipicolinate synthase
MVGDKGMQTLSGSMTALVTPFRGGDIDWAAMAVLLDRQIEGGTDWLVPCGTTGETPTLSDEECTQLIELTIERAAGKCSVMVGTGANSTRETLERTKHAAALGADAALLVTPYYNRPTQEGMFRHYAAIAERVDLPLVLYNVPLRTGVNLSNDTVVRLRERYPHIAAIKDASGCVDHVTDLLSRSDITVLCGDDALTWPMMALGAEGVISVISNLVPRLMKSLVESAQRRDMGDALVYHRRVFDLAMGLAKFGPNPIPIKTAMAVAGLIAEEFRLPLCPADPSQREAIEALLRRHEILEPVPA